MRSAVLFSGIVPPRWRYCACPTLWWIGGIVHAGHYSKWQHHHTAHNASTASMPIVTLWPRNRH